MKNFVLALVSIFLIIKIFTTVFAFVYALYLITHISEILTMIPTL